MALIMGSIHETDKSVCVQLASESLRQTNFPNYIDNDAGNNSGQSGFSVFKAKIPSNSDADLLSYFKESDLSKEDSGRGDPNNSITSHFLLTETTVSNKDNDTNSCGKSGSTVSRDGSVGTFGRSRPFVSPPITNRTSSSSASVDHTFFDHELPNISEVKLDLSGGIDKRVESQRNQYPAGPLIPREPNRGSAPVSDQCPIITVTADENHDNPAENHGFDFSRDISDSYLLQPYLHHMSSVSNYESKFGKTRYPEKSPLKEKIIDSEEKRKRRFQINDHDGFTVYATVPLILRDLEAEQGESKPLKYANEQPRENTSTQTGRQSGKTKRKRDGEGKRKQKAITRQVSKSVSDGRVGRIGNSEGATGEAAAGTRYSVGRSLTRGGKQKGGAYARRPRTDASSATANRNMGNELGTTGHKRVVSKKNVGQISKNSTGGKQRSSIDILNHSEQIGHQRKQKQDRGKGFSVSDKNIGSLQQSTGERSERSGDELLTGGNTGGASNNQKHNGRDTGNSAPGNGGNSPAPRGSDSRISRSSSSRGSYSYVETETGSRVSPTSVKDADEKSIVSTDKERASPTSLQPVEDRDLKLPQLEEGTVGKEKNKNVNNSARTERREDSDMSFVWKSDGKYSKKESNKNEDNKRMVSANVTVVSSSNEVVKEWLFENQKGQRKYSKPDEKQSQTSTNGRSISDKSSTKSRPPNSDKQRSTRSSGDYFTRHNIQTLRRLQAEAHWTGNTLKVQIRAPLKILPPIGKVSNDNITLNKDVPVEVEIVQTSVPEFSKKSNSSKTSRNSNNRRQEKLPVWHWKRPPHIPLNNRKHPHLRESIKFSPSQKSVIRRRAVRTPFETRINVPDYRRAQRNHYANLTSTSSESEMSVGEKMSPEDEYSSDYNTDESSDERRAGNND